jgi:hypothetical protein
MRRIAVLAISLFVALSVGGSFGAQKPPTDVSGTFEVSGLCDFDVRFDITGKGSTIFLPGGSFIMTSPGLMATLTNLDAPDHQVTLNVTGSITITQLADGTTEAVMTGRNLFFDPRVGFVLLIGHWRAVTNRPPSEGGTLIEDLDGNGQLIDVCALLS